MTIAVEWGVMSGKATKQIQSNEMHYEKVMSEGLKDTVKNPEILSLHAE